MTNRKSKLKYVLASGNTGKLREITSLFTPLGYTVHPQSDWQVSEADETETTFIGNALIKATHAARHTGLASIADDSGLVVPALGGRPGIYSARYAGDTADAGSNIDKLLTEMSGKGGRERLAYFYCVLVLMTSADDPAPLIATGQWFGRILDESRGAGGFGYDPVFGVISSATPPQITSAAELTADEKGRISHRGKAMEDLIRQLRERDGRIA